MNPSYVQFHPLAYLVKLNIEMVMANLIKRIAISSSHKGNRSNRSRVADEFNPEYISNSGHKSSATRSTHARRSSIMELSGFGLTSNSGREDRTISVMPNPDQIKVTRDIHVQSQSISGRETGEKGRVHVRVNEFKPEERSVVQSKSVDDLAEDASVKSDSERGKAGDSDDERSLVVHKTKGTWRRLD